MSLSNLSSGAQRVLDLDSVSIGKQVPSVPLDVVGRTSIAMPGPAAVNPVDDVALIIRKNDTTAINNYGLMRLECRGGGGGVVGGHVGYGLLNPPGNQFGLFLNASNSAPLTSNLSIDGLGNVALGSVDATVQLQLSTDGAAKTTTSTWTVTSDRRFKEDIEDADLSRCYEIMKTLPLRRYRWKDIFTEEQATDRSRLGWIADEVEPVFPKAVRTFPVWRYTERTTDEETGDVHEEAKKIEDVKTLNTDQLYATMYGAIQHLIHKVEALTTEVESLKSGSS